MNLLLDNISVSYTNTLSLRNFYAWNFAHKHNMSYNIHWFICCVHHVHVMILNKLLLVQKCHTFPKALANCIWLDGPLIGIIPILDHLGVQEIVHPISYFSKKVWCKTDEKTDLLFRSLDLAAVILHVSENLWHSAKC